MEHEDKPLSAEELRTNIQLGIVGAILFGAFWIHPGLGIILVAVLVALILFK